MYMLDQRSAAHFKAFGFVVFRGLLSVAEAAQLREEAVSALASAYGPDYADDDVDVRVTPSVDVPTMTTQTPFAANLVADDPRFWQAAHCLMGGPVVPANGEVSCFFANATWHADMTEEVAGVKFMIYLEPCSADTGQMLVMPGTHIASTRSAALEYIGQDPGRQGYTADWRDWPIPSYGIDTRPGDVIAFHSNLLHASQGGRRRNAWDIYYFPDPVMQAPEQRDAIRDAILYIGNYNGLQFDHEKWPVWREWARSGDSDTRVAAANRLRRLGVLSIDGADIGLPVWQAQMRRPAVVWSTGAPSRRRAPAGASV